MKTVSAVIAALLALTTLAPGALASEGATSFTTADARATSHTPASSVGMVTGGNGLSGSLESLAGVPLEHGGELRAEVVATNLSDVAVDEVVLRLDVTRSRLSSREDVAAFLEDPAAAAMVAAVQEPPEPEVDGAVEASSAVESGPGGAHAGVPGMAAGGGVTGSTSGDSAAVAVDGEPGGGDAEESPEPVGVRIAPHGDTTFTLEASAADLGLPTGGWGVYGATLTLVTETEEVPVDSFPLTWGAQEVPQLDLAVLAEASGVPSRVQGVLEMSDLPGVGVVVDPTHLSVADALRGNVHDRDVFRLPAHAPDITSIAHTDNQNLMPLALSLPHPRQESVVTASPWLAIPAAVDQQSVQLAQEYEAAAVLALPSAVGYEQLAATTDGPVVRTSGMPVLLPDATLSETVAQFRPGTPTAAALAVADSALLAGQQLAEPALVTLDSEWHVGRGAESTLRALLEAPWVSTVAVSSLLEDRAPRVEIAESLDHDANLPADQVGALGARLDSLTLLATVAESPEAALAEWGSDVLRGISVTNRGRAAPRDLALRKALEDADHTLSALRIADSSDLNLLTETGDIPVNLVNGLNHPVTVTVDLHSYSSNLQVLESPTVTVPPTSDQVVLIPVEAVSTANVFVTAILRNADADPVSDTRPFSIRVRADWGNAATAVFSVVLVLLLVAGLVRTIRRGRKDTREKPSAPPETMDGDDG